MRKKIGIFQRTWPWRSSMEVPHPHIYMCIYITTLHAQQISLISHWNPHQNSSKYQGAKVAWVAAAILFPAVLLRAILNATFIMTMMGIQKCNCPLRIFDDFCSFQPPNYSRSSTIIIIIAWIPASHKFQNVKYISPQVPQVIIDSEKGWSGRVKAPNNSIM